MYICRLINMLSSLNHKLTLDPPIPGSPCTPSAPGLPGPPFNDMQAARCYLHCC